jgi:hypothetical protein
MLSILDERKYLFDKLWWGTVPAVQDEVRLQDERMDHMGACLPRWSLGSVYSSGRLALYMAAPMSASSGKTRSYTEVNEPLSFQPPRAFVPLALAPCALAV